MIEFLAIGMIGCTESRSDATDENHITKGEVRDENGNLLAKGKYNANDEKDGLWVNYYADGKVKDSVNYLNNELDGRYISFFPNGRKMSDGFYISDKPEGEWLYWNEDGSMI